MHSQTLDHGLWISAEAVRIKNRFHQESGEAKERIHPVNEVERILTTQSQKQVKRVRVWAEPHPLTCSNGEPHVAAHWGTWQASTIDRQKKYQERPLKQGLELSTSSWWTLSFNTACGIMQLANTFVDGTQEIPGTSRTGQECSSGKCVRPSFSLELILPVTLDPIAEMSLRIFFQSHARRSLDPEPPNSRAGQPSGARSYVRELVGKLVRELVTASVDVSTTHRLATGLWATVLSRPFL